MCERDPHQVETPRKIIVARAWIPDSMVIAGSSGSLQMVDHTLIDVPLVNVYLDSPYYKGLCKVMRVSSPVHLVIIVTVRSAREMLPDPDLRLKTREELEQGPVEVTTMMMTTKVVICLVGCSKMSSTEGKLRIGLKEEASPDKEK